jgi:hypothetical protein
MHTYTYINIYINIYIYDHCDISSSSSGDLSLPTTQLIDLKPGTAYFVRIVSKNDKGSY